MSYLLELSRSRPIAEQFPPQGRAADREPWSGNEVETFAALYRDGRDIAEIAAAMKPGNPQLQKCKAMLKHFLGRRNALLASWKPGGSQ